MPILHDGDGGRGRFCKRALSLRLCLALLIVGLLTGCGLPPTQAPSPAPSGDATPAAPASGSGSAQPAAKPTAWPGNAVIGIEAMGVSDGQIAADIGAFNRAIAAEDLGQMRRVADDLAGTDVVLPNVDRINLFEPLRPFGERYAAAIKAISAAAKSLRAAIDAQDAASITASSRALLDAFELYVAVQPELAAWVEQSLTQRRLLSQ